MKTSMQRVIMTFFAGIATVAFSQEGVRVGDTVILPYVDAEITYDNNVFQQANGKEDIYWQYTGGLRLEHQTDSFKFDSAAWAAQRMYEKYSEKDSDRWGLAGALGLFSDKSRFSIGANLRQVDDYDQVPADGIVPSGFEGTVDQAFDRTISDETRRIVDFNIGAGQQLTDNLDLAVAYGFYQVNYDSDAVGDWHEHAVGAELSSRLTDKTVSFLNAQFATQGGDGAPDDGKSTTVRVGLKNSLTDKSTIRAGVGFVHYTNANEDYLKPSFDVAAQWAATQKVLFFVNGRNEFQPTGADDRVKIATRAATGIRYQMLDNLGVVLSGAVVHDKDQSGSKDVTVLKVATLKVDYQPIDSLSLFASTELTDATSDAAPDYDRFRGTVGMKYSF